ncbi:SlyX family protein [Rhodocyclus gracilis]|uniref:SlyX protein n=1 Tax=Rhodocyclus tenuis TaxID=1066 RepID=A0A6L5JVP1_RHOTE|nr:SlyX family protein [Rhodocyclus gracilis]MQY51101.1 SlyX protein [Rhodocyclus gracilis]
MNEAQQQHPEAASEGERLADLEIRVNAAEDLVETLNRTIFRQQQQLDLLQAQLRHLHRQMTSAAESNTTQAPRDLREDIPPHY